MNRYRSSSRTQGSHYRSLIVFLLVASFGILFVGCRGPEERKGVDEFVFTPEDVAHFDDLENAVSGSATGAKTHMDSQEVHLALDSGSVEDGAPVLDLSLKGTYDAIRMGPSVMGENLYRVTNEFLNVRTEPKVTAASVVRLTQGDLLTVLDFVDAAWAKVKILSSGQEGYVAQRYIAKLVREDHLAEEKKAFHGMYFVDFGFLNVRKEPDSQSEKIGELLGQSLIRPTSIDDVWARIPFEGKEAYVASAYLSPFLPNFLVRQEEYSLPVLQYHLEGKGGELLSAFARHVDHLRKSDVHFMTFRDFHNLLLEQEDHDVRLSPKSVILTFSGVSKENVKDLVDILRTSGVAATLFIETQGVGLNGITEKVLLTLLANGLDLQSGAHTGDDLRSLTNAQVDLELRQSRQILESLTQRPVFAVAYPQGGVNDRVRQKAQEAGYLLGVGSAMGRTFMRDQLLRLPSFMVTSDVTDEEVNTFVFGEEKGL